MRTDVKHSLGFGLETLEAGRTANNLNLEKLHLELEGLLTDWPRTVNCLLQVS